MPIYMAYMDPPEPPEYLWLVIDLSIRFDTKQDIQYVKI